MARLFARLLMAAVYFAIVPFFAAIVRLTGDPLALKPTTPKGWRLREADEGTPHERATRQF